MRCFAGLLSIAAATLPLGGCADEEAAPPTDELQEIADGLTEDVFVGTGPANGKRRFQVPAASLTVAVADEPAETVASGVSRLGDDRPLDPGQVQPIGSNTKVVTAVLVMRLVEEGRLDLDERLPQIAKANREDGGRLAHLVRRYEPRVREVTLHELLNHTSGLQSWDDTDAWTEAFVRDPLRRSRLDRLSSYGLAQPAIFSPGARGEWNYSNTDYTLLGMVLEAVSGDSVRSQMEALFDEIGMDRSAYAPTPVEVRMTPLSSLLIDGYMPIPPHSEKQPAVLTEAFDGAGTADAVIGHPRPVESVSTNPKTSGLTVDVRRAAATETARDEGHRKFKYVNVTHAYNLGMGLTAGGIVSNSEDVARFWRALFDGELVEPETLELMKETVPVGEARPKGVDVRWGIGFGHQQIGPGVLFEGSPAYSVWYHLGNIFGYSSASYYVEEEDVVVTNTVDIFPQPVGDLGVLREVLRDRARAG